MSERNLFKWRHYQPEIILLCVRWYLRYSLSYRDLEEIMAERGLGVDHTTIYRWVQHYAPAPCPFCMPSFGLSPVVATQPNSGLLCGKLGIPRSLVLK